MAHDTVLLADIGGTHARFAVATPDALGPVAILRCADFPGLAEAAQAFLAGHTGARPSRGLFAVAASLDGDGVDIPNSGWRFSLTALAARLGLDRLEAINDFTALAVAVPHLAAGDFRAIGGGFARPGKPVAVIGPGTGLGVSALVPLPGGGWVALDTEGGDAAMAAANEREAAILEQVRQEFGHVAIERVVSGPGLVVLYRAVAHRTGQAPQVVTPADITRRALAGDCPLCREALDLFFAFLGTAAAGIALTLGARGGVVLAGGILPRLADAFAASGFRARFEDHGSNRPYLAAIPTRLVTHPQPAFAGLMRQAFDGERPC